MQAQKAALPPTYWLIHRGISQNGWFRMENPMKMNDFRVPLFWKTPYVISHNPIIGHNPYLKKNTWDYTTTSSEPAVENFQSRMDVEVLAGAIG